MKFPNWVKLSIYKWNPKSHTNILNSLLAAINHENTLIIVFKVGSAYGYKVCFNVKSLA